MPTVKLTKKNIDSLSPSTARSGSRYFDTDLTGFGITVLPSGKKSFFIYYGHRNKRRYMVLGTYGILTPDKARRLAKQKLAEVTQGNDPLKVKRETRNAVTFEEWSESYLERIRVRKKHPREDERYLSIAKDRWKGRTLDSLTATDIQKVFSDIVKSGKTITANRWLASVRACLQEAWRMDQIQSNPAMKVRSNPENPGRTRVLDENEFTRLIDAIDELRANSHFDPSVYVAFSMLVGTGARLSEVLHTKWEDLDFNAATWYIPATKSGKPQRIPLTKHMVMILNSHKHNGTFVINGKDSNKPRSDLKRPWKYLLKKADIEGVSIHDIRRTFGLQITSLAGLHVASKLLRHSDIRVTEQHYSPLGIDSLRDALKEREKAIPVMTKTNGREK